MRRLRSFRSASTRAASAYISLSIDTMGGCLGGCWKHITHHTSHAQVSILMGWRQRRAAARALPSQPQGAGWTRKHRSSAVDRMRHTANTTCQTVYVLKGCCWDTHLGLLEGLQGGQQQILRLQVRAV